MSETEKYIEEMDALRCEMEHLSDVCEKLRAENELLSANIAELKAERHYHLGQIEAYRFALKGGAE